MKTILLFFTFFISSLFQFTEAQSLSAFYKVTGKEHVVDIEKATSETIKLESLNDETIDLKFSMKVPSATSEATKMIFSLGNNQTVDFIISFINGGSGEFKVTGQPNENNYFLDYENYDETEEFNNISFSLRIAKDNIRVFLSGEMGGSYPSKKFPIDSRDITIKMETAGKATLTTSVDTEHLHSLSSFSDNGLKIRQTPDLRGKQVGSIPFGEKIYVLENLDKNDIYDSWSANTQGDLKVGNVSSRMIKVLYNDKIGYSYGGFLMPFERLDKSDTKAISLQGWSLETIDAEEVHYQKQLALQKIIIEFPNGKYADMDVSQRKLLLAKLFLGAFTMEQLNVLCQENKAVSTERYSEDFIEVYNFEVENNAIIKLEYRKTRKGFFNKVDEISTRYVNASQLNMRSSIDPKSDIITKIPMGAKVTTLNSSSDYMVLGGIRGKMTRIKYKDQEGFVFDAYLSGGKLFPKSTATSFELEKQFKIMVESRGFSEWEHRNGNIYEPSGQSIIVSSRDKFQAIKTLREFYPLINELKFTWNKAKKDYDITTNKRQVSIEKVGEKWLIYKEIEIGTMIISVETLADNIQIVTFFIEEIGC
jgi:hypothetical protein